MVVQVVALEWKWLFIYPEQNVATVNELVIPVGKQVRFEITADAPMNAFWIPELGGMIYAMTGMVTKLHLIADKAGEYQGLSANYSGEGFAQMKFVTKAVPREEFDAWALGAKQSSRFLNWREYSHLAEANVEERPLTYSGVENGLHERVVMQFMESGIHANAH
jgi:heme/copper-type cytochrome/quinol oxidase subunit 2